MSDIPADEIPFVAFGNDELAMYPLVQAGDSIPCPHCDETHALHGAERVLEDGTKEPSTMLLFYGCRGRTYLAAIDGRLLPVRGREDTP